MYPYSPANKPAFRLPDGIENELTEELLKKYLKEYYYEKQGNRKIRMWVREEDMEAFDEAIKKEFVRQHEIMYDVVSNKLNKLLNTRNKALFNGEDLRRSYEMFKIEMNRNRDKGFRVDDSSYGFFSYLLRMCKL